VRSPHEASTEADPDVASSVHLLHRRRGWIWTAVGSVVAWLVTWGLLGSLAPNAAGAGEAVAATFVLLLTIVGVVAIVAAIVDTVKLHRRDPSLRQKAAQRTAHYPVLTHAYRYPPRHGFTWVFGWLALLLILGLGIAALPGLVDGVAYLAGAENSVTFTPTSYGQSCTRGGCKTVTDGYLGAGSTGAAATWPDQVPLGRPFTVHQPVLNWGFGSQLMEGDGSAIATVIAGGLLDGFSVLVVWAAFHAVRNWLRHRRQRAAAGLAA
jgi:hypothetical protein